MNVSNPPHYAVCYLDVNGGTENYINTAEIIKEFISAHKSEWMFYAVYALEEVDKNNLAAILPKELDTVPGKFASLDYCFTESAWEDAARHLCDLLEYVRLHCENNDGWVPKDLQAVVKYYGKAPKQIKDNK